jgi:hypothetical protein
MEIIPVDRTDRAPSRLADALTIYRQSILAEAQHPESQIRYWIDHGKKALADEFRCFVIRHEKVVTGYLQYSYFREEQIFFFVFLCIRDQKRVGLLPTDAIESIRSFLTQNYPADFTVVFEVAQKKSSGGQWKSDKKLISYFKRLGFRTVDFPYRYPVLQSYGDFSYPADLMVSLPGKRVELYSSELRTILRCIYFKHYLRWDRPFLDPESFRRRQSLIEKLFSVEVSRIGDDDKFDTDGDDKRSFVARFTNRAPQIGVMFEKIFGPKMPRILGAMSVLAVVQHFIGGMLLIPFVLATAAVYCLAEDTDASRKLFSAIIVRFSHPRRPS